jgi:trehalose 6-phosphate phosphatase
MDRFLLDHLPVVGARLGAAGRVLLVLDYDGTLTPIVARPEQAVLSPRARGLLNALASHPRFVVVILSGRALDDVEERVGVAGLIYAGNHGLEIRGRGVQFTEPTAVADVAALRALTDAIEEALAGVPGVLGENKGLTASVHVRQVPESRRPEVRATVEDRVRGWAGGFRVTTGHAVFEIRPPVSWNKGDAALWIKEQCAADVDLVVVVGDDLTDEDVFQALPDAVTVKVGQSRVTAAEYWLPSPEEVAVFLSWLVQEPDAGGAGRRGPAHDPSESDAARGPCHERRG